MSEKVWSILCVRDDSDIAPYTIKQMFANGIDGMIVSYSHLSHNGTLSKLVRLSQQHNIQIVLDDSESFYYYQGKVTTKLANACHALGADWIVPFDADELFYTNNSGTLVENLDGNPLNVILIPMWNYCATGLDDKADKNPCTREQWHKKERNKLNKVCFRWSDNFECANGNHSVVVSGDNQWGMYSGIEIGHFQNRTPEQMIRKIRNERQVRNEQDPNYGYWHKFAEMTDDEITDWWKREYYFENPEAAGLVHRPVPYRA